MNEKTKLFSICRHSNFDYSVLAYKITYGMYFSPHTHFFVDRNIRFVHSRRDKTRQCHHVKYFKCSSPFPSAIFQIFYFNIGFHHKNAIAIFHCILTKHLTNKSTKCLISVVFHVFVIFVVWFFFYSVTLECWSKQFSQNM